MKKIMLTLTLLLCMSNGVFSQGWENESNLILGVRGGLTIAPTNWDGDSYKVFPTTGIAASFKIAKLPFYVETGLYYTNRFIDDEDNHSILVPALLSYHIPLKKGMSIQPFMGPFVSYGFDEATIDGGLRLGVGFNKNNLYLNCGYDLSMNYGVDEDALFINIGYNF